MIKKITSVLYFLFIAWVFTSAFNQQAYFVDWISSFTVLLFLIGSIGDAFNLNLGKRTNWKLSWVISVIYNLGYLFYLDRRYGAQHDTPSNDLVGFLILAPVIYMSYHFAFSTKSEKRIITDKIAPQKKYHKAHNNQTLNDESFFIVGLRKLKNSLASDWDLSPSTIVMESAIEKHKTSVYEGPEQDYESITTHILRFESLWDNNKLTKSTIERYQKQLDKISAKYVYDESLDYLYCGLYELQACIHKAEGDNEAAIKFLTEAAEIKPHSLDFVSRAAQEWYSQELKKAAALSNEMYKKNMGKRRKFSKRAKIIVWSVVGVVALLIILANPISDFLTIKGANPTMLKLAQDAGMSRKGELVFLRTDPQLVSDAQMSNVCSSNTAANNSNGFIEQGCYDPTNNRIYLRQMPSDLYSMEVSTAAYEMLHPVYIDLYNAGQGTALNKAIEENYQSINDSSLNSQVANFAKTEPGARDLELFSLLGTGYTYLSDDLTNYYQPYFSNISMTVAANNAVYTLFQNDDSELTQLNNTLNSDQSTINTVLNEANTAYDDSVSWANDGNAYEDNYNFNIYSQDYNIYSQDIDDYNNTVDQYNQTLDSYDKLVTEYDGQQFNQANTIESQQQQSQ